MSSVLTITLPLPPKELSPNARSHWARKANAVRAYRTLAFLEAMEATMPLKPQHHQARVTVAWFTKTLTRPDGDNALASLKPAFDGVTKSGYLSDDRGLTHEPITFAKDAKNPRVEITFTPTDL